MPSKYNKTLATVGIIVSIALGLNAFGLLSSEGEIKDTVKEIVSEEIAENDKLDDGKYYSKTKGTQLETNMENLKEDMTEIKVDVKDMKKQMTQQYILLEKINAKLDDSN